MAGTLENTPGGHAGNLVVPEPVVVIVSDGKPGHLSQSRGLAMALVNRVGGLEVIEVSADQVYTARWQNQALVLAAGSGAYRAALSLKRKWKCPAVALMNPGLLVRRRFDLCVIPRHDQVAESRRVVVTEGALNTVNRADPSDTKEREGAGVILVGGPSGHHDWDEERLMGQLEKLAGDVGQSTHWTATSSRRTPESTERVMAQLAVDHSDRLAFIPASETPQGWVTERLLKSGEAWVTEDSVSMVYEALTAGCAVGLLDVPRKLGKPGRVVRGVMSLIERGWVTGFGDWEGGALKPSDQVLAEADRVAGVLLERMAWPKND